MKSTKEVTTGQASTRTITTTRVATSEGPTSNQVTTSLHSTQTPLETTEAHTTSAGVSTIVDVSTRATTVSVSTPNPDAVTTEIRFKLQQKRQQ